MPFGRSGAIFANCSSVSQKWSIGPSRRSRESHPSRPRHHYGSGRYNSKPCDECLRQAIFSSLKKAQIVIALWQTKYNRVRPHSSLGYQPLAPVSYSDLASR
ncbi:integrase core domain-containing protein [Methylobacterium mesophilicum]